MKSKWKVCITFTGAFTSFGTHPKVMLVIHNYSTCITYICSKYPLWCLEFMARTPTAFKWFLYFFSCKHWSLSLISLPSLMFLDSILSATKMLIYSNNTQQNKLHGIYQLCFFTCLFNLLVHRFWFFLVCTLSLKTAEWNFMKLVVHKVCKFARNSDSIVILGILTLLNWIRQPILNMPLKEFDKTTLLP